jgi:mRNA-degrading endonuclease RelE of RelBE toxin-antitoxin system
MKSRRTRKFRDALLKLPANVRHQAAAAYRRFRTNPYHPSLHFKKVHPTLPIYSARINDDYRVVGQVRDNGIVWFWIGKHEEYERLLKSL